MSKKYIIKLHGLTGSEAFRAAASDELRVLLALIERDGAVSSADSLAKAAGVMKPRASAALVFWEESGIICALDSGEATITEEFEESLFQKTTDEQASAEVATEIRDGALETVIAECARLMGKPMLNTQEIKHITALNTQLALSCEYILALAAYMADSGKLTALRLSHKGFDLVDKGIDNLEELERFIARAVSENATERELRKELHIYDRALSKTEKKYFAYWTGELGYSPAIIGEAYDFAVLNTGKYSLAYMNTLLKSWHEAGCKTVGECRSRYELERPKAAAKARQAKQNSSANEKSPRFADFNSEDALMRALERSYGKKD